MSSKKNTTGTFFEKLLQIKKICLGLVPVPKKNGCFEMFRKVTSLED
jgi:hypothetical protein